MKIVLPFFDDSTLMFASEVGEALQARGHHVNYVLTTESNGDLSKRQISTWVDSHAYHRIPSTEAYSEMIGADAVIAAKALPTIRQALSSEDYRKRRDRTCHVVFQPGLELTPDKGFSVRRDFDVVFLNSVDHMLTFREKLRSDNETHVTYGHPYFKTVPEAPVLGGNDIVFFAQAICPFTRKSRLHVLRMMNAIALAHPDRKVVIKLRHLVGENQRHSHRERYPYEELIDEIRSIRPPNLVLSTEAAKDVLRSAGIVVTCTSTAAMDGIARGIPTAVYLDYPENYLDRYAYLMRNEFSGSGVIRSLSDILNLDIGTANPSWVKSHFRGDDLYDELEAAITNFAASGT